MKKIKILMLHLAYGGIEKQTILMANSLANDYDIEIISFYKMQLKPAYNINSKIKITYLYDGRPNRDDFKNSLKKGYLIKAFKEGIKAIKILYLKTKLIKQEILKDDADIYFSTREEYGKILSKYGNKNKLKITQEHNFFNNQKYQKQIIKNYQNLDYIIVISKEAERLYKNWFNNCKVKILRIPNIIDYIPSESSNLNNNAIIAVGRFNYIKDFLNLIEVMNILVKENPHLKLYLIGDGEEKNNIINKIKKYKLENNIILPGFIKAEEVKNYMLKSDLYVMTSLNESFSLVIIEAYSCALPIVSYDILAGPHELVKDNQTGFLIKERDPQLMAQKITQLLNDKNKLQLLSKNAKEESKNYTSENIKKIWKELFK